MRSHDVRLREASSVGVLRRALRLQSGQKALEDWGELDLEMSAAVAELSETQAHAERLLCDKHALEAELHRLKAGLREAGLVPDHFSVALPGAAALTPRAAAAESAAEVAEVAPALVEVARPRSPSPSVRHSPQRGRASVPMHVPEAARALMRPTAKSVGGMSRPSSPAALSPARGTTPEPAPPRTGLQLDPAVLHASAALEAPGEALSPSGRRLDFAGDGTVTVRFDAGACTAPLPELPMRKAAASCAGALQSTKGAGPPSPLQSSPSAQHSPSNRGRWPKMISLQHASPSALLPEALDAAEGVKPNASPQASALSPVGPLQASSSTHRSGDTCALLYSLL